MIKITITHSLIYAVVTNAYLFIMMISTSPRVWGYQDYPQTIKDSVPIQTKNEIRLAIIISIPWIIFLLGFPIISTYTLKKEVGSIFSFWMAFKHLMVMVLLANIGDAVLLDWLTISKITPKFVVIPGTKVEDYKDFSHHYKGHAKAIVVQSILCLILAGIVQFI